MRCRNHPGREATAVCQKLGIGYCRECCACPSPDQRCACSDPKIYCRYRTQCLIWELARERRKPDESET